MEIKQKFEYEITYLPNSRCRNPRKQLLSSSTIANIREINKEEAPLAFLVTEFGEYPDTKECPVNSTYKHEGLELPNYSRYITYPIRVYEGDLYREVVTQQFHTATSDEGQYEWQSYEFISSKDTQRLSDHVKYENHNWILEPDRPYDADKSVLLGDDRKEQLDIIRENFAEFLLINGRLYSRCNEPRYEIVTFGLGFNHGGTDYFVSYDYNPNLSKDAYYRADQFKLMKQAATQIELNRGDTKSVAEIKQSSTKIKVLRPDLVQCKPQTEAGEGDPFMNKLEKSVQASSSKEGALFNAFLTTFQEIKK